MLAPLTCGVVLLISGATKVGRPAATRDAFIAMGVPQAPPLRDPGHLTPVRRDRPRRAPAGHLVVAAGGRRGRDDGAVRGVLGARAPGAAAWRGGRLRLLRSPRRRPGLGDDAGAQLPAGGARRPCHGLRSRRFRCAARAARLRDRGLVVARPHGCGGGHGGAGGGAAPSRSRRSTTTTCSTTTASRSPSPYWRTRPAPAPRCGSWPAERPQLLVFLSSTCGACETVALRAARLDVSRLGPVEVSTVFTEPLGRVFPRRCGPNGIPAWFDVESGATDTFAHGRPSAVLLGADGALAGGPVAGANDVATFVEDIVAELDAAPELPGGTAAPGAGEPPPSAPRPRRARCHGHGSDDGHGHA